MVENNEELEASIQEEMESNKENEIPLTMYKTNEELEKRTKKKIKKHFRKNVDLLGEIGEQELPIIEMYRVYKSYQDGVGYPPA